MKKTYFVTVEEAKNENIDKDKPSKTTVTLSILTLFAYFIALTIGIASENSTVALIASCVSFVTAFTLSPLLELSLYLCNSKIAIWLVSAAAGCVLSGIIYKCNPGKILDILSIDYIGNVLTTISIGIVLATDIISDLKTNLK